MVSESFWNGLKNYLVDRKQSVKHDNGISKKKAIKCGKLQGSILGPLPFLIYINDNFTKVLN